MNDQEKDISVRAWAEYYTNKFMETKNFAYAMAAFCNARTSGEPIPEVILKFLDDSFKEWIKNDGTKSLDEILGIKPGRGKKSVLSDEYTKKRNERLFETMARLIALGWSVKDAAEGACGWLHRQYEANPKKYYWLKPSKAGRAKDDSETILDSKTLEGYWYDNDSGERAMAEQNVNTFLLSTTDEEKTEYQKRVREWMGKL